MLAYQQLLMIFGTLCVYAVFSFGFYLKARKMGQMGLSKMQKMVIVNKINNKIFIKKFLTKIFIFQVKALKIYYNAQFIFRIMLLDIKHFWLLLVLVICCPNIEGFDDDDFEGLYC